MNNIPRLTVFWILLTASVSGQSTVLDGFFSSLGWEVHHSDAVIIDTSFVPGRGESCLRMDFDFVRGSGYGGVNKRFALALPENFKFTFWLKAEAPLNNFEFKLIDSSGENVWWLNQRNFEFPVEWQQITIKKRHIDFAWGPAEDRSLKAVDKIEFIVASSTGGKGTIWLDDLQFEALPPVDARLPLPLVTVSSRADAASGPDKMLDANPVSFWRSSNSDRQEIILDFRKNAEYGGLVIDWSQVDFAVEYRIETSPDGRSWQPVYQVDRGKSGRGYIPLKDCESRYLRLLLYKSSRGKGYAIHALSPKPLAFSETAEAVFREIAADKPRGYFPRYFYDEQPYWTLVGVNNDRKEALVSEDGAVEVDKSQFSIEPFILLNGEFLTWNEVEVTQSLEADYLPLPQVEWLRDGLALQTGVFAGGEAGRSVLYLNYRLQNRGKAGLTGTLFLALRPFQVNSPWQFLNWPGGTAKIHSIQEKKSHVLVNGTKAVIPLSVADGFGAAEFNEGDISDFIAQDSLPSRTTLEDPQGYASAAWRYRFSLAAGEEKTVRLAVPFYAANPQEAAIAGENEVAGQREAARDYWKTRTNTIEFNLPPSGQRLVNILRSNLAYILINRDGPGIQPGSRSYERSWIRDGSLTSSALLKLGIREEVREFLDWYAGHQFNSGKVPCVVDSRGPDPVPENDSHGQLIFALYQYYLFTQDTLFLRSHFPGVVKAVSYMDTLVALRSTAEYRVDNPEMRARYGLFPESISHEGYSAKPMHSFWDDFFGMKGYKDAVEIATVLGEKELAAQFARSRDRFKENLYRAIRLSIQKEQIDFIPGCVELGDFDATSTAIAIYPCNELPNLPQPYAQNTFDRYFDFFVNRRDHLSGWGDYTPYETRLIGTYVYLGQPQRAQALIDFFLGDQRPAGWNHWAEVVRNGYRSPGFIGDMPHTWVGSDFVSALRAMFVYEDEPGRALVIGAGLYDEWVEKGMGVERMPTYYGLLDYSIRRSATGFIVELGGDVRLPPGGIRIRNFAEKMPVQVLVNGTGSHAYDTRQITIGILPAVVEIRY